jgi:hypothetical protein
MSEIAAMRIAAMRIAAISSRTTKEQRDEHL